MIESSSVIHYPGIPMAKYGAVPDEFGGGNKYRIIWAPSRMVTLTGRDKTMTVPMYIGPYCLEPVGEFWILEGWRSPVELCGTMTAEDWNADPFMLNTGPFPARGDYVRHETLAVQPADANIEKLITWIEEGKRRKSSENLQACVDNMEYDLRDRQSKRHALLRDSMRPFGAETMVGYGGARNSKTYPLIKSREQLGLPDQGVTKSIRPKNPVIYEVPQEA